MGEGCFCNSESKRASARVLANSVFRPPTVGVRGTGMTPSCRPGSRIPDAGTQNRNRGDRATGLQSWPYYGLVQNLRQALSNLSRSPSRTRGSRAHPSISCSSYFGDLSCRDPPSSEGRDAARRRCLCRSISWRRAAQAGANLPWRQFWPTLFEIRRRARLSISRRRWASNFSADFLTFPVMAGLFPIPLGTQAVHLLRARLPSSLAQKTPNRCWLASSYSSFFQSGFPLHFSNCGRSRRFKSSGSWG